MENSSKNQRIIIIIIQYIYKENLFKVRQVTIFGLLMNIYTRVNFRDTFFMVKQVTIFVLSINIYLHVNLTVIKLYNKNVRQHFY